MTDSVMGSAPTSLSPLNTSNCNRCWIPTNRGIYSCDYCSTIVHCNRCYNAYSEPNIGDLNICGLCLDVAFNDPRNWGCNLPLPASGSL